MNLRPFVGFILLAFISTSAQPQDNVVNLYTARHYQTDEALYTNFTQRTGIRINRIEGGEDALFERIRSEGANSPADVFITVDVGRLWRAEQAGIFERTRSEVLEARIPASYRHPEGQWFGFSARARVIAYNNSAVKPGEIANYEDLAAPKWKGRICVRSSSHPYNLSLIGSMIVHLGEARAEEWVRGLKNNLARDPKGGDTDQLKAVAAGECDVAIANTYYIVRLMRSTRADDRAAMQKLAMLWPNQSNRGVHMNISGGGVLRHAPHKAAATRFLEYLASDEAQAYFAEGNNEWPVVANVKTTNRELESLGRFKADAINVGQLGQAQPAAQRIADRAGYR